MDKNKCQHLRQYSFSLAVVHRCRVIPVISKRMLQIHKQHPSTRTNYGIRSRFRNQEELPGPFITLPMVKWLGQLCGTLESLTVDKRGGAMQAGMLPQLLMAARDATKLRSIRMLSCPIEMADLCSLALLSQLRHLTLEKCPLSVDGPQMYGLQCLSSLQSLQVRPLISIITEACILGAVLNMGSPQSAFRAVIIGKYE